MSLAKHVRTLGRGPGRAHHAMRRLLKKGARILLVAPALDPELQQVVADGRADWHAGPITPGLFEGAAMAFIGTGCPGTDASLHALARAAHRPVNIVDQPDLCELTTPALVDRDPVVVAIGSEGTAPVLTREIKTRLERILPRNLGGLSALAGRVRPAVSARVPRDQWRAFWAWVFKGGPPQEASSGHISLVGAGPGARDLLTLRAVEHLQEADVIFYDRLVDPDVLELARRDAERVYVGKTVGAHDWPQDRITAAIIAEARKGRRVVRLKSGDPGIFGRAAEELDAARTADLPVEIVPGVTAACAAAAHLGRSLTERGVTDTLVLTTGTGSPDAPLPNCTRLSGPGTTTVFYMAVRQAERVSYQLMTLGLSGDVPVEIAVNISKRDEICLSSTVAGLASDLNRHEITGCAVLLLNWPKTAAYDQLAAGVIPSVRMSRSP